MSLSRMHASQPSRGLRFVKLAAGFAVLGPVFGGFPYVLLLILAGPERFDPGTFFASFFFAYLFGAVPALLTGATAAVLLDRQGGRHWYAWSALAGLVIAFSFGLWMSYKPSDAVPLTSEVLQAFVGAGLPGLWGAFLTAWSLAKLGIAKFPPEDA